MSIIPSPYRLGHRHRSHSGDAHYFIYFFGKRIPRLFCGRIVHAPDSGEHRNICISKDFWINNSNELLHISRANYEIKINSLVLASPSGYGWVNSRPPVQVSKNLRISLFFVRAELSAEANGEWRGNMRNIFESSLDHAQIVWNVVVSLLRNVFHPKKKHSNEQREITKCIIRPSAYACIFIFSFQLPNT